MTLPSVKISNVQLLNAEGTPVINEETRYRLLKLLHEDPSLSQRKLAEAMGISLGKVNYCMQALLKRGLVKARNFKNSQNKIAYTYYLTPQGIDEKARITVSFLRNKLHEYERLVRDIEELRKEVQNLDISNSESAT